MISSRWPRARRAGAVLAASLALATAPVRAEETSWTGFYLGGHLGTLFSTTSFSDPNGFPIYGGSVSAGGLAAGGQAGYGWQVAPRWVLGVEGEFSVLGAQGSNTCQQWSMTIIGNTCQATPRELATLAGRAGFLLEPGGKTMVYGKAGIAWLRSDVSIAQNGLPSPGEWASLVPLSATPNGAAATTASVSSFGPMLGAGFEYAFAPRWSLKGEYSYLRFGGMSLAVPGPVDINNDGTVTNLDAAGASYLRQDLHLAKIGLNYRFGGPAGGRPAAAAGDAAATEAPYQPGWEFDVGARFWFSSGRNQNQTVGTTATVSRLTYGGVVGQTGELFARVDSPFDVFAKGMVGGGSLSRGSMYDEDWGLDPGLASVPSAYQVTRSDVLGSINYITGDIGYALMRGRDHRIGPFVGYTRYETVMNAVGCPSGCSWQVDPTTIMINQTDAWQAIRLGISAEAVLWKRLKVGADIAWLPYVRYDGVDRHFLRNIAFPVAGNGTGVQGELILTWMATEKFGIGIGGRYWAMQSSSAMETGLYNAPNSFPVETDRYGVFLQASYKFTAPR